jgi:hypothetical protein
MEEWEGCENVQLGTKMKEIQKKVAIDQENKKTKKSKD